MSQLTNDEVVHRYAAAHTAHDYDTVGELRHPEWTTSWPQTGERVRGHANDRAIMDNWPGGLPESQRPMTVVGTEDRWVATPSQTFQRVVGSGEAWWIDGTADYPDGSTWHIVGLLQLRDGLVHHETWYFAPSLDAPAWRAQWVERDS